MTNEEIMAVVKVENGEPKVITASVASKANAQRASSGCLLYIIISIITGVGGLLLYFFYKSMLGFNFVIACAAPTLQAESSHNLCCAQRWSVGIKSNKKSQTKTPRRLPRRFVCDNMIKRKLFIA